MEIGKQKKTLLAVCLCFLCFLLGNEGKKLFYYERKGDAGSLRGEIDLSSAEVTQSKKPDVNLLFEIQTPKRTYLLYADREEEMRNWIFAIKAAQGRPESEARRVVDLVVAQSPSLKMNSSIISNPIGSINDVPSSSAAKAAVVDSPGGAPVPVKKAGSTRKPAPPTKTDGYKGAEKRKSAKGMLPDSNQRSSKALPENPPDVNWYKPLGGGDGDKKDKRESKRVSTSAKDDKRESKRVSTSAKDDKRASKRVSGGEKGNRGSVRKSASVSKEELARLEKEKKKAEKKEKEAAEKKAKEAEKKAKEAEKRAKEAEKKAKEAEKKAKEAEKKAKAALEKAEKEDAKKSDLKEDRVEKPDKGEKEKKRGGSSRRSPAKADKEKRGSRRQGSSRRSPSKKDKKSGSSRRSPGKEKRGGSSRRSPSKKDKGKDKGKEGKGDKETVAVGSPKKEAPPLADSGVIKVGVTDYYAAPDPAAEAAKKAEADASGSALKKVGTVVGAGLAKVAAASEPVLENSKRRIESMRPPKELDGQVDRSVVDRVDKDKMTGLHDRTSSARFVDPSKLPRDRQVSIDPDTVELPADLEKPLVNSSPVRRKEEFPEVQVSFQVSK